MVVSTIITSHKPLLTSLAAAARSASLAAALAADLEGAAWAASGRRSSATWVRATSRSHRSASRKSIEVAVAVAGVQA